MAKLLIISSNVHKELASRQLANCLQFVKKTPYDYQVQILESGSYEIPFVINAWHQKNPFDAYIALGLVLKTNMEHYEYIMSHIKHCFSQFALSGIAVGNGIISGISIDELAIKIDSDDPCVSALPAAVNAVSCLIQLKNTLKNLKT